MGKVKCIFCEKEREKAKEHIWPRWLVKEITGTNKAFFSGTHISLNIASFGRQSQRTQSSESLVFGSVCKICNNGWMNSLENQFRPILKKIRSDYQFMKSLSKSERQSISKWAMKTVLMINAGSNYRRIIPQKHFVHIGKYLTIPKDVKIEICHLDNEKDLLWEQSNFMLKVFHGDMKYEDPTDLQKNSYIISMQIEKLGIKVMFYNECKRKGCHIPLDEGNRSIRIWPYKKNTNFSLKNSFEDLSSFHMSTIVEC